MATEKTEKTADRHSPGDVVKLADSDRYALVVGYTDEGHPLVFDLPGTPREHQTGTERI